ncbi:phenylalanine 4-monooxygenase [Hymenobacter rubripertinctus]|uniref:Phenylalanine-4-hydroxylase n=1 Tax=Hymenobacter rubripertinctus TaxID=2029981 RepID=A0A418QN11_9BACT|nr:phenylalanine 4-monooxygenase [Hymenobacter rubripertinctus]RIY06539.1 phenylalanine 4-monooxygenase [Hymenobacter rubripertinctus]
MQSTDLSIPSPARPLSLLTQDYDLYTAADQHVWQLLFDRQMELLPGRAAGAFLEGVRRVGFTRTAIPDFREVSPRLRALTGWELVVVPGIVDDAIFFQLLADRKFPATTWLRTLEQLDYLEEPDMFHDVFGHVPLLTDPDFAAFLQALGVAAGQHTGNPAALEQFTRLYWFTAEFGLLRQPDGLRIYGAGLLSSHGEVRFSLSEEPTRLPFSLEGVLSTPFEKDKFQDLYFELSDMQQLPVSLQQLQARLA